MKWWLLICVIAVYVPCWVQRYRVRRIFLCDNNNKCVLFIQVARDQANKYGCLVQNPETNQVLHYVEKPETFISDLISCGVYLFDVDVFTEIKKAMDHKKEEDVDPFFTSDTTTGRLSLERDLLRPLSEAKKLYVHVTEGFWKQIKTAG
jgi:mannose-1-phosphate guanylyltransferase